MNNTIGGTNHHPGNKLYRKIVEDHKVDYVNCKRLDKPLVALGIIREWRGQSPPGRFLKMDDKTGLWNDVGDKKAREKTSQALRERAPQIRQELEKERITRERKERGESTEEEEDVRAVNRTYKVQLCFERGVCVCVLMNCSFQLLVSFHSFRMTKNLSNRHASQMERTSIVPRSRGSSHEITVWESNIWIQTKVA